MVEIRLDTFPALLEGRFELACWCPGCPTVATTDLAMLVREALGHASGRMTLDVYAHFVPTSQVSGAKVLASQLAANGKIIERSRALPGRSGPQLVDESGGRDRDRTCDPYHVKVVLYR